MGVEFPLLIWIAIGVTIFVAGLSQGAMGFGFPAISTPLLALMTDIKTAVLLNLLPNMTVNLISVIQGGNWRASLGVYWPVAIYTLIGSFIGAGVCDLRPRGTACGLLLAAIILVYLYQKQIALLNWDALMRRPRTAQATFGLAGGFFFRLGQQRAAAAADLFHAARRRDDHHDADPQPVFSRRQNGAGRNARRLPAN